MTQPTEKWAERLQGLTSETDAKEREDIAEFVQDLYEAAQKDLDDQRAQAEYEREE